MSRPFAIEAVRAFTLDAGSDAGTYFQRGEGEHWLTHGLIANPMSGHPPYRETRASWGIDALTTVVVEVVAEDGTTGVAAGSGGAPAAWLVAHHLSRFLRGEDARNANRIWDAMHRATLPYGRKGIPVMAISAVDLALWDLMGKLRGEPVYNLVGGLAREEIAFYGTGPDAGAIQGMGFWGAKVPLPEGPFDGEAGLRRNVEHLAAQREAVGPGYPLMVDCYMALDAPYAIRLASVCAHLDVHWWEEPLSPDDVEGHRLLKRAHPTLRWTTGEHEYTRYGFRRLIEERTVDVLQPDVMWCGGLTELMRIAAHAGAYDIPVVPHGSGPYAHHFVASQTGPALCEHVVASPDGRSIGPVFGALFEGEPVPEAGRLRVPDAPGFGMTLAARDRLTEA